MFKHVKESARPEELSMLECPLLSSRLLNFISNDSHYCRNTLAGSPTYNTFLQYFWAKNVNGEHEMNKQFARKTNPTLKSKNSTEWR
jgi:hypothetical protein